MIGPEIKKLFKIKVVTPTARHPVFMLDAPDSIPLGRFATLDHLIKKTPSKSISRMSLKLHSLVIRNLVRSWLEFVIWKL